MSEALVRGLTTVILGALTSNPESRVISAARSMRKKPRQSRAKTTVEAIQEGAFQVLRSVGYEKLTTTRVAERAGVSVGTLYQYYANKDGLMQALVIDYLGPIERALMAVLTEESDELNPGERHRPPWRGQRRTTLETAGREPAPTRGIGASACQASIQRPRWQNASSAPVSPAASSAPSSPSSM